MYKKSFILVIIITIFLTGCMYPQEKLTQNQVPYEDQVLSVQNAVNQFQKDSGGLLPIKTKEAQTPIYQKYPIDFRKIVPKYLPEAPGNSFENGGIFQYVLIDVETNPTVKLIDLRITEAIREIKLRIRANGGYPPYKEKIGENVYSIDYTKLAYDEEPYVVSPFSNLNLPLIAGINGEIYVDYRIDLFRKLKEKNIELRAGDDILQILVKDSLFVPAYSLPYTIDENTNEPIFLKE